MDNKGGNEIVVQARRGGPLKCPRGPCSECSGDRDDGHHFSDLYIEFAHDEPEHEAAKTGLSGWLTCKHCDAWEERLVCYWCDEVADPEGDLGPLVAHASLGQTEPFHAECLAEFLEEAGCDEAATE